MKSGRLVVIVGPMYSGKTSELLQFVEIYSLGKKLFKSFKPQIYNRYADSYIVSHTDTKVKAHSISKSEEILEIIGGHESAVFIDEIQFFDENLKDVVQNLILRGIDVYCSGLDLSYKNNPFNMTTTLMAYADEIIKKKAVCHECGEYTGTITYKTIEDDEGKEIDVGGFEKYISVCRDCYVLLKQKEEMRNSNNTNKIF